MKFVRFFFLTFLISISTACAADIASVVDDTYFAELPIIETFMGSRRTNVGCHSTLYPHLNLPLAINCHPYNPTDVLGSAVPACASHPLVIKYAPDLCRDMLPDYIRTQLGAAPESNLFLNVQSNPWNGTPIQLRAHAFSDFFPGMGGNYSGVSALVCRGDGTVLLNTTSSVHLHDGIASPSNFDIAGLDHTHIEDFYSIVGYGGRTVITRHILLTVPTCEIFQELLCTPVAPIVDRSSSFFAPLLGADYSNFLEVNGII